MKLKAYSYRHAEEILYHPRYQKALSDITKAIRGLPAFTFADKSKKNRKLDIVQQVSNTYFDRRLAVDFGWEWHPYATLIEDSALSADYRKSFGTGTDRLVIQVEVQFGNMSRWYSDIFKFQAAYSQGLIGLGVSIVPMRALATRIDSNVVNFERCKRELPAALLSITLPILLLGIEPSAKTKHYDLRKTRLGPLRNLTGDNKEANRYRVVHAFLNQLPPTRVGPNSPTGPRAQRS